jgi:DNA-binding response OmpR family regulator
MHIGVVEDDSDQSDLLDLRLGEGQHGSEVFATLAEPKAELASRWFDLLFVDWMRPDGTGADPLQWLRRRQAVIVRREPTPSSRRHPKPRPCE